MFLYQLTTPSALNESDLQDIAQLLRMQPGTMAVIAQGIQAGVDPSTMTPGYNPYGWVKFYSTVPPPQIANLLGDVPVIYQIAQIPY